MRADLTAHFLRTSQSAAVEAARTIGYGDKHHSDHVATEAMRAEMDSIPMRGRIVIGEGERDEAPMLYIGEKVGNQAEDAPEIDIAVDPLEGTNLTAYGEPNSIAVLAAAPRGGLLHAPDVYLEKIVVGPSSKGRVSIEATPEENLREIAKALRRSVSDLLVVVLRRERHKQLIDDIRSAGARIKLISDGDLAPGIAAAMRGSGVHAVMGAGGAPEGVLTAAALRCLRGEISGRLMPAREGDEARLAEAGYSDLSRVFSIDDLAPSEDILFCATGVTDGALLSGVRFFGGGHRSHSLVMTSQDPRAIRFVDEVTLDPDFSEAVQV